MFRASPRPLSGAYKCINSLWFYRWSMVVAALLVVYVYVYTYTYTHHYIYIYIYFFFFCGFATQRGSWPPHSWGFQITHNDAPQSVGLLWTSDQLVAETSTWQHTTLTTNKHPCPRRYSNPQSNQASGRRPTPWTAQPLGPTPTLFITNVNQHSNSVT